MPSSYTIGAHFEKFAKDLVASGRYASVSEVLRDGLRMLEEREQLRATKLEDLRALIAEGIESGDAGELDIEDLIAEAKRETGSGRDAA